MVDYMLAKLEAQVRQSVIVQQEGDFSTALGEYEFVLEALFFYEQLGYRDEADTIRRLILETQTTPAQTLHFYGLILFHQRQYQSAAAAVHAALLLKPDEACYHYLHARILTAMADFCGASVAYSRVHELAPNADVALAGLLSIVSEQEMPGDDYYTWMQHFHRWLKPASYVEIGIGHGRSLALTGPGTQAIGIDPLAGSWDKLNYICPHRPAMLFSVTSDLFFERYDLRDIMEQESFDLAFIDGLHLFEQALRDFIHLERYAREDSVILIHDCLPIAPIVAERKNLLNFWTGDVWRIMPCLKALRPDLKIMTIPTKPTGLGVVTHLDAASTVLSDNYDEIVHYYLTLGCPESFDQRRIVCSVGPPDEDYVKEQFCSQCGQTNL